mmetsp:Transcript_18259/g.17955  ORF Transcript_18259/g.17955 Transcript_18259/m.17955 type:complete len:220 (-) Transcript_18259:797-1456(-)
MRRNKARKGQKSKKGGTNDIEKYFDTTNFENKLRLEAQIPCKKISTHPLKYEILCIYDKAEIQVIWLDKDSMTEVKRFQLIDNKLEIKSVEFTKDSLLCVLCTNGYVNVYNYEIEKMFRGGFHPYILDEEYELSSSTSLSKTNTMTSSIFCPIIEIDHLEDAKVVSFKMANNLISQGSLITSRHKNSEFTVWDLQPLLVKSHRPKSLHTIDTMGKNKSK